MTAQPEFLHVTGCYRLVIAGQTELPTCPVCLERLDEHISGVVTTVSLCGMLCVLLLLA